MRLFAASAFEPGFTRNLKEISAYVRLNSKAAAVNWVQPENFHLTYAFLGELDKAGAAAAIRGIDAGLDGMKSFSVVSGGCDVFPSPRHPAVIWVGISEGADRLKELAGKLCEGLAAAGLVFEARFEPHITLGRLKGPLPDNFLRRAADFCQAKRSSSRISSVELMESVLSPSGPQYRRVYFKRLL